MGKEDSEMVGKVFVLDNQNRVLLLKRPPGIPYGDLWDLPGGHVQKGEPIKKGAAREVKEETNLSILSSNLNQFHRFGNIYFFWTNKWEGTFKISWEHEEHKWVKVEDLTIYKAGSNFTQAFKVFQNLKGVVE